MLSIYDEVVRERQDRQEWIDAYRIMTMEEDNRAICQLYEQMEIETIVEEHVHLEILLLSWLPEELI